MKKFIIVTSVIVVLAAIVFFSSQGKNGKGKEVHVKKTEIRTVANLVVASGEIQPRTRVNLQSDVIGKIIRLHFKEGDWVKKGQVLVEVDRETILLQRDQIKASFMSSQAQLGRARAVFEDAEARYDRMKQLLDDRIISQDQFDQAWTSYKQAEASLTSAEKDVERSRFMLDELEENLRKTTIRAPMSGRVVQLNMEEGEVVLSGSTNIPGSVIAIIADMSEILAEVDVVESEIAKIQEQMQSTVEVDALQDITFQGHVDEIAHSAFTKLDVNYFKVKVLLEDPDGRLRPGMTARARVKVEEKEDVLTVPIESVRDKKDEKFVFLFEDGIARKTVVTVGISDNHYIEITNGLSEGQDVITGPSRILKDLEDGAEVTIKKEDSDKKGEDEEEESDEKETSETDEEQGTSVEVQVE